MLAWFRTQMMYKLLCTLYLHICFCCASPPQKSSIGSMKFARALQVVIESNRTLKAYFHPDVFTSDLEHNWMPFTSKCQFSANCHCVHAAGESLDKIDNPSPKDCEKRRRGGSGNFTVAGCKKKPVRGAKTCECYTGHGQPCLFGHMSPTKVMLAIAAARVSGVTTIIEEGREGGISSLVYAKHGFHLISVEYLPLTMVKTALSQLAPQVRQLDGDGSTIIPTLIGAMSDAEAARTLVIFDGEKRYAAYATYQKIQARVAAAIFDDTNPEFRKRSIEPSGYPFVDTEGGMMHDVVGGITHETAILRRMKSWAENSQLWRFAYNYSHAHFTQAHFIIVQGGQWGVAAQNP